MEAIKPKYVYRKLRRNKKGPAREYWYSEPPGLPRALIPYAYGTDEFRAFADRRNRESADGAQPPELGTFDHLSLVWRGDEGLKVKPSQQWLDLAEKTRKDYARIVDKVILPKWGADPVADLDLEMCIALRDARRDTPRMANYIINVLASMLWVAVERPSIFGIKENVASQVTRLGVKAGVKPRKNFWTYEDEVKFLEDADRTDPAMAMYERLLAFTGQRPGDCRRMRESDYDGAKIRVMQSKTGAKVWVPCHKGLKPYLDAEIKLMRAQGVINGPFVRGKRRKELGERFASSRWDAIAGRVGLSHLHRQDLRRTAVIRLGEAGCTVPEIASITGHSLRQVEGILETYFVRTYEMAQHAITKLETYQDGRKRGQS